MYAITYDVEASTFQVNGIIYPRIYQPFHNGGNNITLRQVYSACPSIFVDIPYTEITVNNVSYPSVEATITAMLAAVFQPIAPATELALGALRAWVTESDGNFILNLSNELP